MSDPLASYLEDHAAGAAAAVELLESMRDDHRGSELGDFAAGVLRDVESDREILKTLLERCASGAGKNLKEAVSWVGEKVSRLKLGRLTGGELGTLESLETLALGILGKRALWRTLAEIAPADSRLRGTNFEELITRAETQFERVEEKRLEAARTALSPSAKASS